MKEQLEKALLDIVAGNVQAIAEVAEEVKALPRTDSGLFDTNVIDEKLFRAARLVYPVYAAYETECNKKEGYPDLIVQMRKLNAKFEEVDCFFATACFLDTLIHTIENVSPQLYEYYSEIVDMFKCRVNETIQKYYVDGHFVPRATGESDGACEKMAGENCEWAEQMIRDAIRLAGERYVLLAEKYEAYV